MNSATPLLFVFCIALGWGSSVSLFAQSKPLLGPVSEAEVMNHSRIYEIYANRYHPNEDALEYLSAYKDTLSIYVFLGDWCKESTKYIPQLIKTLRLSDNDFIKVNYVGVGILKKEPEIFLKKFDIKYIPSVVVLKNDIELNRIEEMPHTLIETDLVQILKAGIEKDE